MYKGTGTMKEFVESWNIIFEALKNPKVVQTEVVFNPVGMTVLKDSLEIDFS